MKLIVRRTSHACYGTTGRKAHPPCAEATWDEAAGQWTIEMPSMEALVAWLNGLGAGEVVLSTFMMGTALEIVDDYR